MNYAFGIVVVIAATIGSLLLTGRFRRFALKRGLLDVPNERSSHEIPKPRGGGVAIVITALVALPMLGLLQLIPWNVVAGLMSSGFVAAIIGYTDDHSEVSLITRLIGHFAAAACAIGFIGTVAVSHVLHLSPSVEVITPVITALYLAWMLNLTNFMDGIDGLASVETITVCVGAVLCVMAYKYSLHSQTFAQFADSIPGIGAAFYAPLLIAAATTGFLFWNWPPAKIFMGDAGSGFLGIMLGAVSIASAAAAPRLLWCWFILLGAFITDATVTLVRRIVLREKFYQAHRNHAYQHAARRFGHQRVTIAFGVVNLLWLTPAAMVVALNDSNPFVALVVAYVPLIIAAFVLKAGTAE